MMRITGLLFAVVALGLLVAGCDRCGDWYSPFGNPFKPGSQVCRDNPAHPH
jgi:hypothetical protein